MPFYRIKDGETFGLTDQWKAGDVIELPEYEAKTFIGFKLEETDEPEGYQAKKAEQQRIVDARQASRDRVAFAPVVVKAEPGSVVDATTGQPARRPEQHTGQPQDMRDDTEHTGQLNDEEKRERADQEVKAAQAKVDEAQAKADAVTKQSRSSKQAYDQTRSEANPTVSVDKTDRGQKTI